MLILDQIENEMTNYLRQLMEGKKREGRGGGGEREKMRDTWRGRRGTESSNLNLVLHQPRPSLSQSPHQPNLKSCSRRRMASSFFYALNAKHARPRHASRTDVLTITPDAELHLSSKSQKQKVTLL